MQIYHSSARRRRGLTGLWLCALIALCLWSTASQSTVQAQSDLDPAKRGSLLLRIDLERYTKSPFGELFPLSAIASNNGLPLAEFRDIKFDQLQELSVVFQSPKSLVELMEMEQSGSNPLPFNFMVHAQSGGTDSFQSFREMVEQSSDVEKVDGLEYFRPTNGPSNVAAVFGKENYMRVGTDDFVGRPVKSSLSDNVNKIVGKLPPAVVQLALDVNAIRNMIDDLVEMNELDSPAVRPFLEALDCVGSISGFVDFQNDNLLQLNFEAKQADQVDKVKTALEALLGLGQTLAMGQDNPELIKSIIKSLKVVVDGQMVSIVATAPKDMVDQIKNQVLPEMQAQAERVQRMNNLRQVVLAMHMYGDSNAAFPQHVAHQSKVDLSWRVLVLPYLEQDELFRKVDMQSDWDSEKNAVLKTVTPTIYGTDGMSRITAVKYDRPVRFFADVTDGTSNTIAFLQFEAGVPWAANQDMTIDQILKTFTDMKGEGEVLVAFYDGSVRTLAATTDPVQLKAMLTPNGGEVIEW